MIAMSQQPDSVNPRGSAPSTTLRNMITGFWVSQMIYVVAKLGIADLMTNGPKQSDELAAVAGAHAPSLYRVMRALASVGVFTELEDGRFNLTPLASCLQTGVPGSRRAMAIAYGDEIYRAWGALLHGVRHGEPAFESVFGLGFFAYLERNPEAGRRFNEFMVELSDDENSAVVAEYDFSGVRTLIDVGSGYGRFLSAVLHAYPKMRGVLFDLPHVTDGARTRVPEDVSNRCEIIAGDFFEAVPEGGDAYVLSRVLHDWNADQATAILKNCRRAMSPHSRLLAIEAVIPPGNGPSWAKMRDIQMLVSYPGGRERTEREYRELLASAGLKMTRVVPTPSPVSVIEAVPA